MTFEKYESAAPGGDASTPVTSPYQEFAVKDAKSSDSKTEAVKEISNK
jgi:hypothetical protein